MATYVAVAAAIGCSLCTGISTVQQKIGADREKNIRSFDFTFLFRLLKDVPYLFGTFLELLAYGLTLVALRVLPLFLVQSLIAASIVVTALGERVFLHRRLSRRTYLTLAAVLFGLILLSCSSLPGRASVGSQTVRFVIELLPIPLALLGLLFIYVRKKSSAIMLAALGGLAFGDTSTVGRILIYPHPLWRLVENPLLYSLIFAGILGQYLFTVSLQRASATKSNAVMIALQTLGPAVCGLLFFNDQIRSGFELVALLGGIIVIAGSAATAVEESPVATI
jgi:drug/metabolite transporter (DMT)-like permease